MMARWRNGGVVSDRTDCDCELSFPRDGGKKFCILAKLDLQNLQFLGLADLLHLIDVAVGELL